MAQIIIDNCKIVNTIFINLIMQTLLIKKYNNFHMKKQYVRGHKVSSSTEKVENINVFPDGCIEVITDQGSGFILSPQVLKVIPQKGDFITFYTILVTKVVGIELNGNLLYWLSDDEVFS